MKTFKAGFVTGVLLMALVLGGRELQHSITLGEVLAELAVARQSRERAQAPVQPSSAVSEEHVNQLRKRSTQQLYDMLGTLQSGTAKHDWTRAELIEALDRRGKVAPAAR